MKLESDMKQNIGFLFLAFALAPQLASAQICRDVFARELKSNGFTAAILPISRAELHRRVVEAADLSDRRPFLTDERAHEILKIAQQPLKKGQYGPRLITNEIGETPDIDKPVQVTLPDGSKRYFFGLSGQQYLLVDSIDRLARGGTTRPHSIKMYNENGLPYGDDYDKQGQKLPYAVDSSTWDASAVQAVDENGRPTLKLMAGAMANGGNGKPLMISQKNAGQTRRRVVFHDVKWVPDGLGSWTLEARDPKSPFFTTVLRDGSWSRFDENGRPIMIHSYGGGPVKLANGESYPDEDGNINWAGDGVFEVRRVVDAKQKELKYTPYQSGMYMAKLDPTLKNVIEEPHAVLSAHKEDGSIFKEAERPGLGPLVEGGHIEPRVVLEDGTTRAIHSREDLAEIRRKGLREYMIMVGSQGRYDRDYGSFQAVAKPGTTDFKMVVNKNGELYNITSDFNVLTYATGRPVIVHGESGQAYMLWHADGRVDYTGNLGDLSRQIWIAPVRLTNKDGQEIYEILDNTGLLEELRRHKPRPLKEKRR